VPLKFTGKVGGEGLIKGGGVDKRWGGHTTVGIRGGKRKKKKKKRKKKTQNGYVHKKNATRGSTKVLTNKKNNIKSPTR